VVLAGAQGDHAGAAVSGAGDVNGDGFADVIIGAPKASRNGLFSGSAYVVFGHGGGFAGKLNLYEIDGTDGFRIDGFRAF
jgi:hypothetical protein